MMTCPVCDDLHAVVLRTGPQADIFPCPACVGIDPDALDGSAREDAERACREVGVPVRWRRSR